VLNPGQPHARVWPPRSSESEAMEDATNLWDEDNYEDDEYDSEQSSIHLSTLHLSVTLRYGRVAMCQPGLIAPHSRRRLRSMSSQVLTTPPLTLLVVLQTTLRLYSHIISELLVNPRIERSQTTNLGIASTYCATS
jgi:hypothetical protein